MRIVQLSDLHLSSTPGDARWLAFERLLEELPARVGPIDRLVLTGDLAAHGHPATYRALRGVLSPWYDRLRLVPGNHDASTRVQEAFSDRMTPGGLPGTFLEDLDGVRLVGLDSSRPYRVSGKLGRAQLQWLDEVLRSALPSIVFFHHPPIRIGTWWLDKDRLRDAAELQAIVEQHRVLGLVCGHVHQESEGLLGHVPVFATPSTAYQFAAGSLIPRKGPGAAGLRVLSLSEGKLETHVMRVWQQG